jgi:hypothetical protein
LLCYTLKFLRTIKGAKYLLHPIPYLQSRDLYDIEDYQKEAGYSETVVHSGEPPRQPF